MFDDQFKGIMQSYTGCAVIFAGSASDKPHIEQIAKCLEQYDIPYRTRICSAHKQPDKLMDIINEMEEIGGSVVSIAVAGGTDALSGILSFHMLGPVISCPPDSPNYSCLGNPPGSSNAYIPRPENVARFIAQTYAAVNLDFRRALKKSIQGKKEGLEKADDELFLTKRGD